MQNIIETQGLIRRFGSLTAVNKVDLQVPPASVYGFLGPNGAGKTTTIRMLLGLIRPHAGMVTIFGKSIREERLEILGRLGAMVEQPSFYPHLTGRENLEIIRRLAGFAETIHNGSPRHLQIRRRSEPSGQTLFHRDEAAPGAGNRLAGAARTAHPG